MEAYYSDESFKHFIQRITYVNKNNSEFDHPLNNQHWTVYKGVKNLKVSL